MDTGKLILIGVGGFILYEMFIAPASTAASSTTAAPPASATGPVVSAQQAQLQAFITALGAQGPNTLMVAARQPAGGVLDVSQWNYYLDQISGVQLGADLTGYVPNPNAGVTAAQYWTALAAYAAGAAPTYANANVVAGSNLSGVDGLGIVHSSHTPAPWHGTPGDGPGRFDSKDGEIWGW